MSQRLGVNVDHVATLRQVRRAAFPDPVTAAMLAELAGAAQITVHVREDRRHVQDRDLRVLRETVRTLLNLEMAATPDMVKLAYEHKPDVATLVPERREELTTEGGLDLSAHQDAVDRTVKTLKDGDIVVSLFIDPDVDQVKAAHRLGAQRVELHTGRYCEARGDKDRARELGRIADAARVAVKLGMGCAAGHGLTLENVRPIARLGEIDEVNIGHSIVSRALFVGFERAVREMLEALRNP